MSLQLACLPEQEVSRGGLSGQICWGLAMVGRGSWLERQEGTVRRPLSYPPLEPQMLETLVPGLGWLKVSLAGTVTFNTNR